MRICIFGAGAVGGYLGVKLASAGADVTFVARGPHLAAMRAGGVTLLSEGRRIVHPARCTDDPDEAGKQDVVIVTLKAPALPAAAAQIERLLGPETAIVTAMNGVPWWYFYRFPGPLADTQLASVDPAGALWKKLHPRRAIGCVVYLAGHIAEPGVIVHTHGNRFLLGEPDGAASPRSRALADLIARAGLDAPLGTKIRDDIWLKLWGNLSFNPISALTGATLRRLAIDPNSRAVARAMMVEARIVAERLGVAFPIDVDGRIAMAADVGEHKTSMLQDLETGRPMEIDALLGVVVEMARLVDVATPACDLVLALVRQRAELAGCYPARNR
ncbi:MAG: 2-dehydropantoate 2-reductase [Rhodospirillales bacterium]|nr:2-dehydropantoate 2-reductase [Rhodospirillales bacterium]